eukprot:EG_transcript_5075
MVHALCWTVEDVQGWLQSMGMEADIVELFATYKVDGHALLQLDAQRLRDMGLISAIHRKTLVLGIEAIKKGRAPPLGKVPPPAPFPDLERSASDPLITWPSPSPGSSGKRPSVVDAFALHTPPRQRTSSLNPPMTRGMESPPRSLPRQLEGGPLSQSQLQALEVELKQREAELKQREAELQKRAEDLDQAKAAFLRDQEDWRRLHPNPNPDSAQLDGSARLQFTISPNVLVVDDMGIHMEKIQSLLRRLEPKVDCNFYSGTLGAPDDLVGPMSICTRDLLRREDSMIAMNGGNTVSTTASKVAKAVLEIITQNWMQYHDNTFDKMRFDRGKTFLHLVTSLCSHVAPILNADPLLLEIQSPVYVLGDIHGKFQDLNFFMEKLCNFNELKYTASKFLFLGDYVDRGMGSLQVAVYLLAMKVVSPRTVFLLRGNHEMWTVNGDLAQYGDSSLRACCQRMFGKDDGNTAWEAINEAFSLLPLAAVIDHGVFCVHGGIPRYGGGPDRRLQVLLDPTFPRFYSIDQDESDPPELKFFKRVANELMWNDPSDTELGLDQHGFGPSPRGINISCFGLRAIQTFLANHQLQFIIRAHEMKQEGLRVCKSAQVITVFTSSNYCGAENGSAAVYVAEGKLRFISHMGAAQDDEFAMMSDFCSSGEHGSDRENLVHPARGAHSQAGLYTPPTVPRRALGRPPAKKK